MEVRSSPDRLCKQVANPRGENAQRHNSGGLESRVALEVQKHVDALLMLPKYARRDEKANQ